MARSKRVRIEGGRLKTWQDVDDTLRQIAVLNRQLAAIEARQNERIDRIKHETAEQIGPVNATLKALAADLKDYAERHREAFSDSKTRELTFGRLGYRQSTRVVIASVANTLRALLDLGYSACVRSKSEPDKDVMRTQLSDDELAAVGARRQVTDEFWFEVDAAKLGEVA